MRLDPKQLGADTGAHLILEGSVRKQGQRIRVAVRISDVGSGNQLWAQSYDRELNDVFQVQDELSSTIAMAMLFGGIGAEMRMNELAQIESNVESASAVQLRKIGLAKVDEHFSSNHPEALQLAEHYLRLALDKDPSSVIARWNLAHVIYLKYLFGQARRSRLDEGLEIAKVGIGLSAENAVMLHYAIGCIYEAKKDYKAALASFDQVSQIIPFWAECSYHRAVIFRGMGELDDAL